MSSFLFATESDQINENCSERSTARAHDVVVVRGRLAYLHAINDVTARLAPVQRHPDDAHHLYVNAPPAAPTAATGVTSISEGTGASNMQASRESVALVAGPSLESAEDDAGDTLRDAQRLLALRRQDGGRRKDNDLIVTCKTASRLA
eukprot:scaffold28_cov515-Prasinococcus_capsulatus_cf.AAC.4